MRDWPEKQTGILPIPAENGDFANSFERDHAG
jgi:hypothetical protein